MVTLAVMSASQAGAYFEKDMNYFDKDGSGGTWVGKGAEDLGLKEGSRVEDKDFKSLISGMDTNGNQLVKDGNKGDGDRAGLNITYSVDKSVSILGMGDDRIKDMMTNAAIDSFKSVAEKFMAEARMTIDGERQHVATGNLVGAAFVHETSRIAKGSEQDAPDPQLHVHIFAMNMTKDEEGFWKSLSNEQFFAFQKAMGQDFQNRIAQGLEKLGYGVERIQSRENYAAGVKGIVQELREEFSTRGRGIDEEIAKKEAELGRPLSGAEKQIIKNDSRETKAESTKELLEINKSWDSRLADKGYTREDIVKMAQSKVSDNALESNKDVAINKAIETVSDKQSVFSNLQVTGEALKADFNTTFDKILESVNSKMVDKVADLVDKTDVVKLKEDKTSLIKMSSKEIIDGEKNIMSQTEKGNKSEYSQVMSKEQFTSLTADRQFFQKDFDQTKFENKQFSEIGGTDGQKASAEHILTSKEQYIGINGVAGAGKTALLKETADIAGQVGVKMTILTPTGKAADEASQATGGAVDAMTIDKFLLKKQENTGEQRIFVVDESSMVGTKKLSALMNKIEDLGGKLVIMGDKNQHKPVNQGDMFGKLQADKSMNFTYMNQSVRQQSEVTKAVIKEWETGDQKQALNVLQANGNLYQGEKVIDEYKNETINMTKVKESLIKNVIKDYKEVGVMKTAVVVRTNDEKREFNAELREAAQKDGLIGRENNQYTVLVDKKLDGFAKESASSYKPGETLISNKMQGDIKNGMNGKVLSIDKETNTITASFRGKDGEEFTKEIPGDKMKNFSSFREETREFSTGDKIVFEKNTMEYKNGMFAQIEGFGKNGELNVRMENGDRIAVNAESYKHLDHAYAVTSHKAQGGSYERTHVYATADKLQNQNAGYVGLTRSVKELNVYTDDKNKLEERYNAAHIKENAHDYLNKNGEVAQKEEIKEDKNSSITEVQKEIKEEKELSKTEDKEETKDQNSEEKLDKNDLKSQIESMEKEFQDSKSSGKSEETSQEKNSKEEFNIDDKSEEKDDKKEEKEEEKEHELERERSFSDDKTDKKEDEK